MIDKIQILLTNRRGYAFLIPLVVLAAQAAGLKIDQDILGADLDKVAAGISGALALWSLFSPKKTPVSPVTPVQP